MEIEQKSGMCNVIPCVTQSAMIVQWTHSYDAVQRELKALASPEDKGKTLDKLAHFLGNVVDAWKEASQEQRNKLAGTLFEQVWIEHNRVVGIKPRPELEPFFLISYEDWMKKIESEVANPPGVADSNFC